MKTGNSKKIITNFEELKSIGAYDSSMEHDACGV
ncbi:uncharacterized protein METZ01_LOCUS270852, partial [marine metagenome]